MIPAHDGRFPSGSSSQIPLSTKTTSNGPLKVLSDLYTLHVGKEVNAISFSLDSRRLAVALQDHTVRIWDLESRTQLVVLKGHKYWVTDVCFSPDSVRVASASSDKSIKVWNLADGACELTLQGHLLSVAAVAFSDEALHLASGSWDKTVRIWDIERGEQLLNFSGHTDWIHSVVWSPNSQRVASGSSDHSVRIWNTVAGVIEQVLVGHIQTVTSVCFSRNGQQLASGSLDRTIRVWNVTEGTLSARLQQDGEEDSIYSVCMTADADRIVVGCKDKTVKVWSLATSTQEATFLGHDDAVCGVAISHDGKTLVSCSHDKTVRAWQMPAARRTLVPPDSPAGSGQVKQYTVANSFRDMQDRLRDQEASNNRLRRQLLEAQNELDEKNRTMKFREASMNDQERQLLDFRNMIKDLAQEKEKLERSFVDMRRELSHMPQLPAGRTSMGGALPSGTGPSAALSVPLGPAGARDQRLSGSGSNQVVTEQDGSGNTPVYNVYHPAGTAQHPKVEQTAGRRPEGAQRRGAAKPMGFRKEARRQQGPRPPASPMRNERYDSPVHERHVPSPETEYRGYMQGASQQLHRQLPSRIMEGGSYAPPQQVRAGGPEGGYSGMPQSGVPATYGAPVYGGVPSGPQSGFGLNATPGGMIPGGAPSAPPYAPWAGPTAAQYGPGIL